MGKKHCQSYLSEITRIVGIIINAYHIVGTKHLSFLSMLGSPWNVGITIVSDSGGLRYVMKLAICGELINSAAWFSPRPTTLSVSSSESWVCVHTLASGSSPYIAGKAAPHPHPATSPHSCSHSALLSTQHRQSVPFFTWQPFSPLKLVILFISYNRPPQPPPPPPTSVCHFWEAWRGVFIHRCLGKFNGF